MSRSILDGYDGDRYDGVWRLWKGGSLALFAVFVAILADVAATLRRLERTRSSPPGPVTQQTRVYDGIGCRKCFTYLLCCDRDDCPGRDTWETLHDPVVERSRR